MVPKYVKEATFTFRPMVVFFDTSFGTSIPNDLHVWVLEIHFSQVDSPTSWSERVLMHLFAL
jgi:hypothetical protein